MINTPELKIPTPVATAIITSEKGFAPPEQLIFRALRDYSLADVKVVILGQDPYHTEGKASGLAFGYHPDYMGPVDSSLANILAEVRRDTGKVETDLTLERWAEQGVLLLNTRLTVQLGKPMSHAGLGWEQFTRQIITQLDQEVPNKVYMLWGKEAQTFAKHIDKTSNMILETSHPCKFSAHLGFNGCGHFSKANKFLKLLGKEEIVW